MPTVETTVWINAPLEHVYEIAKDNASFPEFMDDLVSLTVIEQEGNRVVSEWVGIIKQFRVKVRWTQEDIWDDAAHTCTSKQVKGDYDQLDAFWEFKEENNGTRFNSTVNYEYNVPTLGILVKKVIHGIVVKNLDNTLNAIKDRAEKSD
ncbi:MAG: SRPBCC family protein [Fimbriimonadaceae bacterium]|nr:SRPBCC family protein [Fimbriimonadaceae bacterium]